MSDEKLAAARMSDAMGKLQDALSRLKLAAEELAIVDASLIGSDAHRRLIVESSALRPIETADDIRSHQAWIEAIEHWEPWVPPRTGSKRYQRRRAQRWPKGK